MRALAILAPGPTLATIPAPFDDRFSLGPLTVRFYGLAIAIGVLVAITILRRRYGAAGGDVELADRIALWGVGVGFLGARLGYVLPRTEPFGETYRVTEPLAMIAVWEGGLALYGGLSLGLVTVLVLLRRWHGDVPAFLDALAPAVPVAQAFGRLGNYFNQELFGTALDPAVPWALELTDAQGATVGYVHPTFAYEALWNLGLAAVILWLGRRGTLRRGSLAFVYMVGYGTIRFLLEFIRTDQRAFEIVLTANGWVSVAVIVTGVAGLVALQRRRGRQPAPDATDAAGEPGATAHADSDGPAAPGA
ncbi:prolipoprotein diacylglyceryl transferase [soil metagenome]